MLSPMRSIESHPWLLAYCVELRWSSTSKLEKEYEELVKEQEAERMFEDLQQIAADSRIDLYYRKP
jgi:hypothetical protein